LPAGTGFRAAPLREVEPGAALAEESEVPAVASAAVADVAPVVCDAVALLTEGVLKATGGVAPAAAARDRSEAVVGWPRISACLPGAGAAVGGVDVVCAATLGVAPSGVLTASANKLASDGSEVVAVPVTLVSAFSCAVTEGCGAAEADLLAARAAAAIASGAAAASDVATAAGASASGTATGIAAASGTTITGATDVPWGVESAVSVAEAEGASVDEVLSTVFVIDFASLVFEADDLAPDCDGASLFLLA